MENKNTIDVKNIAYYFSLINLEYDEVDESDISKNIPENILKQIQQRFRNIDKIIDEENEDGDFDHEEIYTEYRIYLYKLFKANNISVPNLDVDISRYVDVNDYNNNGEYIGESKLYTSIAEFKQSQTKAKIIRENTNDDIHNVNKDFFSSGEEYEIDSYRWKKYENKDFIFKLISYLLEISEKHDGNTNHYVSEMNNDLKSILLEIGNMVYLKDIK